MMDSVAAAQETVGAVYLVTDGSDAETVWRRVETELAAGRRVWLGGALVANVTKRFGVERNGQRYIALTPLAARPEGLYRARDIVLSAASLIVLAPVFGLLAVLVKLSSPGPVFYATTVVGKGRRKFVWRKFRSMRVKRETEDETARREQFRAFAQGQHQGKVIDMTRVTRIGAFLRRYSLDEMPQLWNVLRGEMALVGPRPCLPYEAEMFPAWAGRRFDVRPGLTGIWQVAGRARVTLEEGLAMDVIYGYTRSFGGDLRLMLETVLVMLRGEGGK